MRAVSAVLATITWTLQYAIIGFMFGTGWMAAGLVWTSVL